MRIGMLLIIGLACLVIGCASKEGHQHEAGMKMEAGEATPAQESSSTVVEQKIQYTCPMHPEVIADRPGQCPKCGMNLEKK